MSKKPDIEEWRKVVGFPDYEVSNWGRLRPKSVYDDAIIRRKRSNPRLIDRAGKVLLTNKNKRVWLTIAKMVLMTFDRLPKPGEVARHINDINYQNWITNLSWGTQKDNYEDMLKNGINVFGRNGYSAAKSVAPKREFYLDPYIPQIWRSGKTIGLSNYEIAENGAVRRITSASNRTVGHIPRGSLDKNREVYYHLINDGYRKIGVRAALLVAFLFKGGRPSCKHTLGFLDGDRFNCHANNVYWQLTVGPHSTTDSWRF